MKEFNASLTKPSTPPAALEPDLAQATIHTSQPGFCPGAFRAGALLIQPESAKDAVPISNEQLFYSLKTYSAAVEAFSKYNFSVRLVVNYASQLLIERDPSGTQLTQFQETISAFYSRAIEILEHAKSSQSAEQLTGLALQFEGKSTPAHPAAWPCIPLLGQGQTTSSITNSDLGDARADMLESKIALRTSLQVDQSIQKALLLISRAALDYIDLSMPRDVEPSEEASTFLRANSSALREEALLLSNELREKVKDPRIANENICKISIVGRVLLMAQTLGELNQNFHTFRQLLSHGFDESPAFPPHVLLMIGSGTLYEPSHPIKTGNSPADEEMLANSTILRLRDSGISFEWYNYDYSWGALVGGASSRADQILRDALSAESPASYKLAYLTRVMNIFPLLPSIDFSPALQALASDEFKHYLSDPENWLGPRMLRVKPWLKNQEYSEILRKIHTAMKGGASTGLNEHDLNEAEETSFILSSSLLQNIQGEGLLFNFILESARLGQNIAQVKLERIGNYTAREFLDNLCHTEQLHMAPFLFVREPDGESISLSAYGVSYLTHLVDPNHPFYEEGDDNHNYINLKAKARRARS